ncbi:MAG: hypothetical protein FJ125_16280, partial [Deltaproteobacteria bacterium]|nr:hypothetical protein [Deltaproteobacteria bacterium]
GLLSSISQRIDKVILERLRGTASVGEFVAGASLVEKLAIIPEGLGGATYPALAGLVDRDRGAARVALARFLTLAALIGLPTALGGVLVAGPLIRLIFGSGFPEAVAVFAVAVWVLPAWSFLQVLNVALIAVHQERKVLVVTAAGTVLLLVGNLLLVPLLGTLGSAVALCGSQWFVTLVLFVLVFRLYGQVLEPRPLLHIFTGLLVMSVGVLLTHQLPLFVQTAVGVAIYLAAIWPQARELLRLVRPARSVRPPGPLC